MGTEHAHPEGIAARVESFIRREGAVASDDPDFGRGVDLLSAGYLDSLGIIHLIAFLEQEFKLTLSDEILTDERIATINGISLILDEHMRGMRITAEPSWPGC